MKKFVNLNNFWADQFAEIISAHGIREICISPGSRSTPLTAVFALNKKFKKHIIIDERSSGFFALGIAKASGKPVVLVTTSGTAVAELYPAVIEAYQQRIPLIVCTADRPEYLIGRGANQTINQNNIYANHIRFFADLGLPSTEILSIEKLRQVTEEALNISMNVNPGPVHLNFPFEKPLEPLTKNAKISAPLTSYRKTINAEQQKKSKPIELNSNRILFMCGWDNYNEDFTKRLTDISIQNSIPVIADGASNLRFGSRNNNLISNASAFLSSSKLRSEFQPEVIVQFGNAPTSNVLLEYFKESKAKKILVNKFGDWKDPSNSADELVESDYGNFLQSLSITGDKQNAWLNKWIIAEEKAESVKTALMKNQSNLFEGKIITELLNRIPAESNVMISNSLPIRDFDIFSGCCKKQLHVFTNRGASGIDGIISTSLGISKSSGKPTYLLIGDLAFLHDTNGLLTAANYKIPLNIILINNNGGAIFKMLPVSNEKKIFETYFKTPQTIDFSNIAKTYGAYFKEAGNWKDFASLLKKFNTKGGLNITEFKTGKTGSDKIRIKYKETVAKEIEKILI